MAEDLPELPKKLTLWQRLSSTAYEAAMSDAIAYKANLQAVMEKVEATEAGFEAREADIEKRENDVRSNETRVNRMAREKNSELDRREAEIAAKEAELKAREDAIAAKEANLKEKTDAAELKEKEADATIERFREREEIAPEISIDSLKRDEIIRDTLAGIKETSEKLLKITQASKDKQMTTLEKIALNNKKAELRAAILATVCLYRDSLPEMDRLALDINGKSCAVFLQEQAELITEETKGNWIQDKEISEQALYVIDSTYKKIASELGVSASPVYETAAYRPFEGRLSLTDPRNAGMAVFSHCIDGRPAGLKLYAGYAQAPRATTDVVETTNIENEINETAKYVDDWEK